MDDPRIQVAADVVFSNRCASCDHASRIINAMSASAKNQAKTSASKTGTEKEEPVMQRLTW
jgi:hypothetical protein